MTKSADSDVTTRADSDVIKRADSDVTKRADSDVCTFCHQRDGDKSCSLTVPF